MGKRNNVKEYTRPLPIAVVGTRMPEVFPHNVASWVYFGYRYLVEVCKPVEVNKIVVEYDGQFKVTDHASMMRLWREGFFGKGSLSRSEPTWEARDSRRLGMTNEDITKQRRNERRRFKELRAEAQELEAIARTRPLTGDEEVQLAQLRETVGTLRDGTVNSKEFEDAKALEVYAETKNSSLTATEYLQLQPEEVMFLAYLEVVDVALAQLDQLLTSFSCYAVYHHFRSLGWCARSGIKFGCHWLLYKRGPPFHHAEYGVLIVDSSQQTQWTDMLAVARVIGGVKKTLLVVYVKRPTQETLTSIITSNASYKEKVTQLLQAHPLTQVMMRRWVPAKSRD